MVKPKLAFVDLAIHKVTQSSFFLRKEFEDQFDISDVWYEYDDNEDACIDEIRKYDFIFMLQVLLPYSELIYLQKLGKKIVWAPMYDGLPMSYYYWSKIASTGIKIISFSGGIDRICKKHDIDFISVRYYKKPLDSIPMLNKEKFIFYFWFRGSIRFTDWIQMIPLRIIDKIYYYSAPLGASFKTEELSSEEIAKYNIHMIELDEFSINRNIFLEYLEKSDIFVCPRMQDGIGLPLIEALSYGKYLIGNNDFTMKDYIRHGENGVLYTPGSKEHLDAGLIRKSKSFRQQYAVQGFAYWEKDKEILKKMYNHFTFIRIVKPGLSIYAIMAYEWSKKITKRFLEKI